MTAIAIRKKLADYIQLADIKKLKAVYTLLEADFDEENGYSEELKKELDIEHKYYKSGGKMITPAEAEKYIAKVLQNSRKK